MGLNGIDVSSWQADLDVGALPGCDFVVVKATGGAGYTNECFVRHAEQALAAGRLLGCYHYARESCSEGTARQEADHFLEAFAPYVGRALPFLDWEADALELGVGWALEWLDRVREATGVAPGIYMSKAVLFSYDWSPVAATYPLWVAQYANYDETGFDDDPWTDGRGFGAWEAPLVFQYSGTGRLDGYDGRLDLDLFYGTADDWRRLCEPGGRDEPGVPAVSRANVAAQVMEHLCVCDLHGYSQPGRLGTDGCCEVETDAGTIRVSRGDRDCSSSTCEAWELALAGTAFDGLITRHNWTGGMREMFLATGLFSWEGPDFPAERGDVYLCEGVHAAMCLGGGLLGEFRRSETGDVDGEVGDQTGDESWVRDCYGGWDGVLHYNGLADSGGAGGGAGAPSGDVSSLAARVIAGEFGNGEARRAALGVRYDEVQADVNRILSEGPAARDVEGLARRTIAGEFGNGSERMFLLGDAYEAVQARVNEILGGADAPAVDVGEMARAVIRGDYGNGEERRQRLGSYYLAVQERVNEMLS